MIKEVLSWSTSFPLLFLFKIMHPKSKCWLFSFVRLKYGLIFFRLLIKSVALYLDFLKNSRVNFYNCKYSISTSIKFYGLVLSSLLVVVLRVLSMQKQLHLSGNWMSSLLYHGVFIKDIAFFFNFVTTHNGGNDSYIRQSQLWDQIICQTKTG